MQSIIILTTVFMSLDYIWIHFFMYKQYTDLMSTILKKSISINYISVILCYVFIIAGLRYFAIRTSKDRFHAALNGGILGLIIYGVYNATLCSFIPFTSYITSLLDVIWGSVSCSFTAYITYIISQSHIARKISNTSQSAIKFIIKHVLLPFKFISKKIHIAYKTIANKIKSHINHKTSKTHTTSSTHKNKTSKPQEKTTSVKSKK